MLQILLMVCSQVSGEAYVVERPPMRMEIQGDRLAKGDIIEVALSSELHITIHVRIPAEVDLPKVIQSEDWTVRYRKWESTPQGKIGRFILQPTRPLPKTEMQILPLGYLPKGQRKWRNRDWPPVFIRVTTSVVDTNLSSIRDQLPLETFPVECSSIPWVLITCLVAVTLASVAGYRLWRRWHQPVPLSPSERAIQSLDLISTEERSRACAEISQVLRGYLDARFAIQASTRTTPALEATLREHESFPQSEVERVLKLCQDCDLGSFTGLPIDEEAVQSLADKAKAIVRDLEQSLNPPLEKTS